MVVKALVEGDVELRGSRVVVQKLLSRQAVVHATASDATVHAGYASSCRVEAYGGVHIGAAHGVFEVESQSEC